jgi:MoxR-like ATPase
MAARSTATKATRAPSVNGKPVGLSRKGFQDRFDAIVGNVEKVIKGKTEIVQRSIIALLADGHVLFEDMPGTGKTMLSRAIGETINASTSRVQCTPDLLPADITGSPVLDRKTGDFVFRPGPVFANILLCDEVNRATPKTQSALLEAMAEKCVTVDGITHSLPRPFFVLATQNPIELSGTFPLPEAQLDRFLFKLSLGYLTAADESAVLAANQLREAITQISPVVDVTEIAAMIEWCSQVTVSEAVRDYIVALIQASRSDKSLQLGASMRASLALMKAARVLAASRGRDDVHPDDVKELVMPVMAHRLILGADARLREETVEEVVDRIVGRIKVPMAGRTAIEAAV